MINSAKALETEIELKFKEAERLEDIHTALRDKILNMQQQHQQLEEFMLKRKTILQNLKQMSARAVREEEALGKLKEVSELD